jgi:ABC-type amino acid transport substrate-binding protein
LAEIDKILAEMHEDGTMKAISEEWHNGVNITVTQSQQWQRAARPAHTPWS